VLCELRLLYGSVVMVDLLVARVHMSRNVLAYSEYGGAVVMTVVRFHTIGSAGASVMM
jgi:hypothetical protein